MNTYINRFFEKKEIPSDLNFDRKIGDVIMLHGRYQIITGYGIYNNQMWTEKYYEDGIHLGAGNYEIINECELIYENNPMRKKVINSYINEILNNYNKYQKEFYTDAQVKLHLSHLKI